MAHGKGAQRQNGQRQQPHQKKITFHKNALWGLRRESGSCILVYPSARDMVNKKNMIPCLFNS
jgi:hypothetical protein